MVKTIYHSGGNLVLIAKANVNGRQLQARIDGLRFEQIQVLHISRLHWKMYFATKPVNQKEKFTLGIF